MAKSLILTYLLWLCGGFLGLHHFYLGRDKQAFIWWCFPGACALNELNSFKLQLMTFYFGFTGGYFGAGWFRDLWRIPEYVREANDDPDHLRWLAEKMRRREHPPFSVSKTL